MKQIDVSVLIPSRGRPDACYEAVRSLHPLGSAEVIVGLDEDDPTAIDLKARLKAFPNVRCVIGPREETLGKLWNKLYGLSKARAAVMFPDDYRMETKAWSGIVGKALDTLPNNMGVPFLTDPSHPGFTTFPVITRQMVECNDGNFLPPWFPFWFHDTWWDEIGDLLGMKIELPVLVSQPDGRGKTQNLIDLGFWAECFHASRPMRGSVARKAVAIAYQGDHKQIDAVLATFPAAGMMLYEKTAHLMNPEFIMEWESKRDGQVSSRYKAARAAGEEWRKTLMPAPQKRPRVALAVPCTGHWVGRMANSVAALSAFSAQSGVEVACFTLEGSMISKQRNDLVKMALSIGCDYILFMDSDLIFPPDTLLKLMAHNKDVVGATYCKKFPPYETLGRMMMRDNKAPTVEEFQAGGLWRAQNLPGGMMLIKAEVFRKLEFPYFFESYQWPGDTGTEALKKFISFNFGYVAPDDVLKSIEDTDLAKWIDSNWEAESANEWAYVSEDINFCRKVDRAGIEMWCDLSISFQLKHVGLAEVSMSTRSDFIEAEAKKKIVVTERVAAE